jgi:hypothetical protein
VISPFVGQGQVCKTSKNLFLINEMANILPRFQKKIKPPHQKISVTGTHVSDISYLFESSHLSVELK